MKTQVNVPVSRDEMNKFRKSDARVLFTMLFPNRKMRRGTITRGNNRVKNYGRMKRNTLRRVKLFIAA